MPRRGSRPRVDRGFHDEDYFLGPSDLGDKRQTTVRLIYANSPTRDPIEQWLEMYDSWEMFFGLDVEWRPNRARGEDNPVAVLQLAGKYGCLIVQLLNLGFIPISLTRFFSDSNVKVAGVGINKDCAKLTRDLNLHILAERIELCELAADVLNMRDLRGAGLKRLCSEVWSEPLRKDRRVTLSDWGTENLSVKQIKYAATDAFMCYHLLASFDDDVESDESDY